MAGISAIVWLALVFNNARSTISQNDDQGSVAEQNRNKDLDLLLIYKDVVEQQVKQKGCNQDYSLSFNNIVYNYDLLKREENLANNIANYLTSMWRYKTVQNESLVENEASIYALVRSVVVSSDYVYGSMICFERGRFRNRESKKFCPYAYKDKNHGNKTRVYDRGVAKYLRQNTAPWSGKVGEILGRKTKPKSSIDYYDVDLSEAGYRKNLSSGLWRNATTYFNISGCVISSQEGARTSLYYNCFAGKTWVMTYLVPFYNETRGFLGIVGVDMEMDSIELDQCDFPEDTKIDEAREQFAGKRVLTFYNTHHCKNQSTKCVHVPGKGFTAGNYRCVCRKGFYFPNPGAKNTYFDGKDVLKAHQNKTRYKSGFNCLPCREGCDECVDDTPCMYPRSTSLKNVLLALNEVIKALAVALGIFIFLYREHKIIKASSPVFMAMIVVGIILMYFEITFGYFEATSAVCITQSWFYHAGFILAFGSLLLKTWRIVVIFRLRSAKMIELTDMALLRYLGVMMVSILVYLMIWTWTSTQSIEISRTGDALKYRRCVRGWFANAINIGEIILLAWGVWLCLRVRNAPSAYNESKYIAWSIYNTVFIMVLVGLLRILLDNFPNPDVSYAVDFLATHVVATILLALLFISKIIHLRNYNKNSSRHSNTAAGTGSVSEMKKSPFRLYHLADGTFVPEVDEERDGQETTAENVLLRNEIRKLTAQLALYESKGAKQQKNKKGQRMDDEGQQEPRSSDLGRTTTQPQSAADGGGQIGGQKNSELPARRGKSGSLMEDIKNSGKTKKDNKFLAVPIRKSVSDESLTVASSVSSGES